MQTRDIIYLVGLCSSVFCSDPKTDPFLFEKFPAGFVWGTATASYQVEGAWNVHGKGVNIWDTWTHEAGNIDDASSGDVACDSYRLYREDVKMLKNLGVSHYMFSISWSRIFPSGFKESYNSLGMQYYKNLISELKANSIQPMVTLFHWDLPQPLEDLGGWLNEDIIDRFNEYADRVFREIGADVPLWITFNEPWTFCNLGYGKGGKAPGITDKPGVYPYQCVHNVIKSHAKAYHTYNDTYKPTQKGKVSLATNIDHEEPATFTEKDQMAAKRAYEFMLGWFANPIYVNGDYPAVMKTFVGEKSRVQGLKESRLPVFTAQEKASIKGTYDFFGLNHYTTHLVYDDPTPYNADISYANDQNLSYTFDTKWPSSASSWLKSVPWGLRKNLQYIRDTYNNPDVYITENGVSDKSGTLNDQDRIDYYTGYINNVLKAIQDGCNVKGYFAWSLMDNFEWARGYTQKFGLYQVNFALPNRPRVPKKSATFFKELIHNNGWIEPPSTPSPTTGATSGSSSFSSLSLTVLFVINIMVIFLQ